MLAFTMEFGVALLWPVCENVPHTAPKQYIGREDRLHFKHSQEEFLFVK